MKRNKIFKIASIYLVIVPVFVFCGYILLESADLSACTGMTGPIFLFF